MYEQCNAWCSVSLVDACFPPVIDQQAFAFCLCLCRLSNPMLVYPPIVERRVLLVMGLVSKGARHDAARPVMNYMQSHHTCGLLLHSNFDITNLVRVSRMKSLVSIRPRKKPRNPCLATSILLFWLVWCDLYPQSRHQPSFSLKLSRLRCDNCRTT